MKGKLTSYVQDVDESDYNGGGSTGTHLYSVPWLAFGFYCGGDNLV